MNTASVLIIAAHPDDELLGLGGTVAKLAAQGADIHLLILTDGSSAQYRGDAQLQAILEEKRDETRRCAEILGIGTVEYGPFPDMKLDTVPHIEVNRCIEEAVGKYRPDTVFTHFWGDVNRDHQCAFASTMVAVRPVPGQSVRRVLCYRTPSSTEWNAQNAATAFMPNFFVDISEFRQQKADALACYEKELRDWPHPRSQEALGYVDGAAGTAVGVSCAEAFVLVRELV